MTAVSSEAVVASGTGPAPSPRSGTGRRFVRLAVCGLAAAIVGLLVGGALGPRAQDAAPIWPAFAPETAEGLQELEALQAQVERGDDTDVDALRQLAAIAVEQAALSGDVVGYAVAEDALAKAARLAPDAPATLIGQGHLALAQHDFARAHDLGTQALQAVPANEDALGVLVDANVELGRYDDAAQRLQALLDRSPALPALSRMSYFRELHGDLDGARRAMRQARVAGGSSAGLARVDVLLGDLALQQGDLAGALDAYRSAAELVPSSPAPHVGRARVLAAGGQLERAAAGLRRLVEQTLDPAALFLLADLEQALGNERAAEEMVELVRAAAALQESAGQVVDLEMALLEADHGDTGVAVRRAGLAHAERPDNVFAQDALAWALYRDGQVAQAAPLATSSLRLGGLDPDLRAHAALIAAAAGDESAARASLRALPWLGALPPALRTETAELAGRLGIDESELPR